MWLGFDSRERGVSPSKQGFDAVESLHPYGGQYTAQRGTVPRSLPGLESARDLRPQILFGLAVSDGHCEILRKVQLRSRAVPQPSC